MIHKNYIKNGLILKDKNSKKYIRDKDYIKVIDGVKKIT